MSQKILAMALSFLATFYLLVPVTGFAADNSSTSQQVQKAPSSTRECKTRKFGPAHHPAATRRMTICDNKAANFTSADIDSTRPFGPRNR